MEGGGCRAVARAAGEQRQGKQSAKEGSIAFHDRPGTFIALAASRGQPQESATVIILLGLMGGKGACCGRAEIGKKPNCSIAFAQSSLSAL
jgi:hypothetical protein